jgi:hypothetical protein
LLPGDGNSTLSAALSAGPVELEDLGVKVPFEGETKEAEFRLTLLEPIVEAPEPQLLYTEEPKSSSCEEPKSPSKGGNRVCLELKCFEV